jgi:hypothetical protein
MAGTQKHRANKAMRGLLFAGALLAVALPSFAQLPSDPKIQEILRFTLDESPDQIVRIMGRPTHIDDSLKAYQSWQYDAPPDEDNDDNTPPAWFFCVSTTSNRILSVTRNFDKPRDVHVLFPATETAVHYWPSKDAPQYTVLLRWFSGERLLLAMGAAEPRDRTTQLVLIRRSALKIFMSWLAERLM